MTIEQRLAALESLFDSQTPQRFPGGMTRASQVNSLDLIMVGSNADGTSKVATLNQVGGIVAGIGSNGYKGPALASTNPGTPTKPEYWSAKAGITYPNFKDANGAAIVIPTKVGDDPVLTAALAFNGASWIAEYNPSQISLVDYPKTQVVNDKIGNEISLNSLLNRLSILNSDTSNIHKSDGSSLTLIKNSSPNLQQSMLSFKPANDGYNQFDLMTAGKIDYSINSVMGFWIDTSEFLNNTTLKLLVYFFDGNVSDLGNHQEIVISKASLMTKGYTFQNGAILQGVVKEVSGSWSYIEYLIKPNSGIGNVNYFRLYFVFDPLVANRSYNFSSFTFLNGYNSLNPYSTYMLSDESGRSRSNEDWLFFADSITLADKYQKWVEKELSIVYKNNAIGGTCLVPGYGEPELQDKSGVSRVPEIIAANPSVLVEAFLTNDFGYRAPLGTISDTGTDTVYGALKYVYGTLLAFNPKMKIIPITPLFGNNGAGPSAGKTNQEVWMLRKAYADAKIEVAQLFGLQYWDAFRESGISIGNYPTYIADGIHPNDAGYKKFGLGMAKFLKTIL